MVKNQMTDTLNKYFQIPFSILKALENLLKFSSLLAAIMFLLAGAKIADAADRHAGYYYPPTLQTETYQSQAPVLPDANQTRRIGFVTAITHENLKRPYPPSGVFFAKG